MSGSAATVNNSIFRKKSNHQIVFSKMELEDGSQNTSKGGNDTATTMVSQGDPNAAYITIPEDLVHLVRGSGGQVSLL